MCFPKTKSKKTPTGVVGEKRVVPSTLATLDPNQEYTFGSMWCCLNAESTRLNLRIRQREAKERKSLHPLNYTPKALLQNTPRSITKLIRHEEHVSSPH